MSQLTRDIEAEIEELRMQWFYFAAKLREKEQQRAKFEERRYIVKAMKLLSDKMKSLDDCINPKYI